jgi:outer membrane biosynthesis protein TonB
MERLQMKTRDLMLMAILGLAACTAVPAPVREAGSPARQAGVVKAPVPDFCKTAYEAGPSYSQADLEARIAERKAALPEGAPITSLTPIVRYGPQFPQCALSYDLEGHCEMVFDVLPDGTTANILPVCSSRLFERDSVSAVRRWTFEPPGDGPRPAVLNRLTFKLDDSDAAPAPPATEPGPVTE